MKRRIALLCGLLAVAAQAQAAGALDSLEAFIKGTRSGRAEFTQVVTAPAKEGQAARSKTSSGTFEFQRPSRFRFAYKKPFEQTIVADGQTLWLHDVDLNQVTARKQAGVLGSTPAALIASAPDLRALQADFQLQAAPDKDGLQWAVATPKARDGQVQSVRIGFKGNELSTLEILDSFGQRSVMTFTRFEVNPALSADAFQFKPPAGAAVVRQ
jgi:outer membrane lipoprotein carrier protein